MVRARRSGSVAIAALLVGAFGCVPGQRSDPGTLEIRNYLRDPVVAIVGGQWHPIPGCTTVQLRDVELRRVRITTQAGDDLMRVDPPNGTPIGPRRFIVIDVSGVSDLRTRPNGVAPNPAMRCDQQLFVPPGGGVGG